MRPHAQLLAVAAASAILLTGCATANSAEPSAPSVIDPGAEHHAHGPVEGPSEPAKMICSEDIQKSVAAAFEMPSVALPVDSFADGLYSCTYQVRGGPLLLSVMESADEESAKAHADALRPTFNAAADIEGLANLGHYAYRTADGVVVFVKDNMTLTVDARQVLTSEAPTDVSQSQLAYQVATNVLACWKAHH